MRVANDFKTEAQIQLDALSQENKSLREHNKALINQIMQLKSKYTKFKY